MLKSNSLIIKIFMVFSMALFLGCQSIEHVSDTIDKAELPNIELKINSKELWQVTLPGGASKEDYRLLLTALPNGDLVAANVSGGIARVSRDTGKIIWKQKFNFNITAGVASSCEYISFINANGELLTLSSDDGRVLWQKQLHNEAIAAPSINNSRLAVLTTDGSLAIFDVASGDELWSYSMAIPALMLKRAGSPVFFQNTVIAGFSNGKLASLKLHDGDVHWLLEIASPEGKSDIARMIDIAATPLIEKDVIYTSAYQGNIVASKVTTGLELWSKKFSNFSGINVIKNTLIVPDVNGSVYALDKATGATIWHQDLLRGRILSKPNFYKENILLADTDGFIHILDSSNGALIGRIATAKLVEAEPLVFGDKVYTLSKSGKIQAFVLK